MEPVRIIPARAEDAAEVASFNERMRSGGATHRLTTDRPFREYSPCEAGPVLAERFFAWVDGTLRGGVVVKRVPFWINGVGLVEVAFYGYPVSEGIVDPRFSFVGLMLQKFVTRRHPLVYGLGTGGLDMPVARLMMACGWTARPVPFRFRVFRKRRFLREIQFLRRRNRITRCMVDLAALTRFGALGLWLLHGALRLAGRSPQTAGLRCEAITGWGDWADEVWQSAREHYALIGDRSAATLSTLYPDEHPRLQRFRVVDQDGQVVGWVVLSVAPQRDSAYFGNLSLGTLVDCLAVPGHEVALVGHALRAMEGAGADLAVSNLSADEFLRACNRSGMLAGPTNFFLFLSPKLQQTTSQTLASGKSPHFTRGDGDGPIHLW